MMVSAEEKRWIVVGVAMNKVAAPVLRVAVTNGMDTNCRDLDRHCQSSTPPSSLKTLSYGTVRANPVIFKDLKFQNINNNNLVRGTCNYNFNINSSVDLAKLYLPGYLAQFSAFDESLDMTALLRLLGFKNYMPSTVFSLHTQACADDVRENVRNKWGHVDVTEWTDALFNDCFIKLEELLKSLGLTATVKRKALEHLAEWQTQGCQLIMENSVVKDALYLLQDEVRDLINTMESTLKDQEAWHKKMLDEYHEQLDKVEEKLQKYSENGSEEVKNILKRLSSFEANLSMRLQAIEEGLADTYGRVEQLEQYQEHLNRRCDNADDKVEKIEDELTKLKIGASSKLDYCEGYQNVIINNHVSNTTGNIAVGSSPCILIKGNTDNSTQPPCSSREELQDGEDVPEIHFSRQDSDQERGGIYSDVSDDSGHERGSMYSDVSDGKKANVIFSYDAKKEDELTLNVGDIVDILRVTEEDGWWSGQLGSKEGLFPSNYVEVIEYEDVAEANNSAVETKHSKLGSKDFSMPDNDDYYKHVIIKNYHISGVQGTVAVGSDAKIVIKGDNECYVNTQTNGLQDTEDNTKTHRSSLGQEGKCGCQLPNRKRRIVQFETNAQCRTQNCSKQPPNSDENDFQDGVEICCQKQMQLDNQQAEGREQKVSVWRPRPGKDVLVNDDGDHQWTIQLFLEDPEQFIREMDRTTSMCKKQREFFILSAVIPYLEKSWRDCISSNDREEVCKILASLSCSLNSGLVVRRALHQLFHLICKENFGSREENLMVVEKIIRSSILSSETLFSNDEHSQQNLKLEVYSRILWLALMRQVLQGNSPVVDQKQDLQKMQGMLKTLKAKRKDVFRYSLEFIQRTISHLLKLRNKSTASKKSIPFLDECQEFCRNEKMKGEDLTFLPKVAEEKRRISITKKRDDWFHLHCVLIYLHQKVHGEPQETGERAMGLIALITNSYLKGGGGADWRFCLLLSSILVDITNNSVYKEARVQAAGCLANCLKDEKIRKTPECRVLLEQAGYNVFFCPDKENRTSLLLLLSWDRNLEEVLPLEQHSERLALEYKAQALEISNKTIHQTTSSFVRTGMFQGGKVAVKVLIAKKKHLLEDNPEFQARGKLYREAYSMSRLNRFQHPNFPVLLCHDTKSLPYHLITKLEIWGDLLQLLRKSREKNPNLSATQLLNMLIDISEALLHLENLGLVHRAIMAENVLVGEKFTCKLSGLHSLQQLPVNDSSSEGFRAADDHKYLPVRLKSPECIKSHQYSTASDVWAFGILMYEVLTRGCAPYSHLLDDEAVSLKILESKQFIPLESCFKEKEYELMDRCCSKEVSGRPKVSEVKQGLHELLEHTEDYDDNPRTDPPPLERQQSRPDAEIMEEHFYDSVPADSYGDIWNQIILGVRDKPLHETTEGAEKKQTKTYTSVLDFYEDCEQRFPVDVGVRDKPLHKTIEGSPVVCENILRGNVQHLKRLLRLNHLNLARIKELEFFDAHFIECEMISSGSPCDNLKEYVLDRRCKGEEIISFLSQVASALHYLHINHIVHGDLRAEYVNVVTPQKVQVSRLARSKSLSRLDCDVTSTSCVVQADVPPDSIRWSAPEVISDGHYTHASDVWAFGILAWELYASYKNGQQRGAISAPYFWLENKKILPFMREKGPLKQPEDCPDWIYIIMHQCWAFKSVQRPPFIAIFDCLTSREPAQSWLFDLWLRNHPREWPNLPIRQPKSAWHVIASELHPPKEEMKEMCSKDFFKTHHYSYSKNFGNTESSKDLSQALGNGKFFEEAYEDETVYEEVIPQRSETGNQQNSSQDDCTEVYGDGDVENYMPKKQKKDEKIFSEEGLTLSDLDFKLLGERETQL